MKFITTRICGQCHDKVILEQNDFIYFKEKYYHPNCFITQLLSKKRNPPTVEIATELANQLKYESANNPIIIDIIDKSHLYQYLQKTYSAVYMPKFIYQKFSDIFNGTYKNIMNGQGIPPCDLLDMWERKQNFLNKTRAWNESKGKVMETLQLIQYDLAIIMSKYDSYLKWKMEQKLIDEQNKKEREKTNINYNAINKSVDENIKNDNKKEDMSQYLEDI
jgi:hypothetical protein